MSQEGEYHNIPLKEKIELLKNKELSVVDNVKYFLKRIKEIDKVDKENKIRNEGINSFIYVNEEEALRRAEELDLMSKEERKKKKLFGLVIGVKSNINVRGYLVSCASKTLSNYYAPYDADVIERIKGEGAVIIGMTNMDEFACGSSGETSYYGPTRNPLDKKRIPGGSSSGSAAAIAAGLSDLTLGSDTGGSIRNPSSHCGIVGVKPTYGLVSRFGLIDLSMSLDQIGPLSKEVFGSALLLSVIAGKSRRDPTTYNVKIPDYTNFNSVNGLKIGIIPELKKLCSDNIIWEETIRTAEKLASKTRSTIQELKIKYIDLAVQTYYPIVYTEFYSGTRKFDGRRFGYRIEESCGVEVLRRILGGKEITKSELKGLHYRKALAVKKVISEEFKRAFEKVDVIIIPTVPKLPHKIGEKLSVEEMYAYDAFTIPSNLAGLPTGVVPITRIKTDSGSVGLGVQVITKHFNEKLMFDVMKTIEETLETHD